MNNKISTGLKTLGLVPLMMSAWASQAADYYISPTGNDVTGDGSAAKPWQTIDKAKSVIRTIARPLSENINVILKDGRYELSSTFTLDSSDSGDGNYYISYQAENAGQAELSGGSLITNWSDPDQDGIWQASVAAGIKTRQLYIDDVKATRARSTDGTGWSRAGNNGQYNAPANAASWANIANVEVVVQYLWKQYRGPIASITGTTATMNSDYWDLAAIGPFGITDHRAQHVSWVENAFELLDQEGEWYLNEASNTLYYKPQSNQTLTGSNASEVLLPRLETLIETNNVSNVRFDGLVLSGVTWNGPSTSKGYVSVQSGSFFSNADFATIEDAFEGLQEIPGGISLNSSTNIVVQNSSFKNLGGSGLAINRGSQNNSVFNNTFNGISAAAISIGNGLDHHAQASYLVKDNVIDNNKVSNTGTDYLDTSAIKSMYTQGTVISNNTIENVPYTGISTGWGWGRYDVENITGGQFGNDVANKGYNSATVVKDTIVINNKISNFANGLGDTGGIYNLGASPGARILSNLIFNGHAPGEGTHFVNGIYLDNGSRGVEVESNGIYDVVTHSYFFNGNGVYNTIGSNNAFHHTESNDANIPVGLKATAGAQDSITQLRSKAQILASLPAELPPVASETMPEFGILVGRSATATANSQDAVNVIDGNPQSYWDAGTGNTSGSITIDTGSNSSSFNSFVLAFGKVIAGEETYIRNGIKYRIEVSSDASNWTQVVNQTAQATVKQGVKAHYFGTQTARYIRLNVTDSNGQDFGVLRFKAYGQIGFPDPVGTNLAPSGTATQVSTAWGGVASRAIDGNTNGHYFNGNSVTHTDLGNEVYWDLDLGSVSTINEVRIWNRTDCCSTTLSNYYVFVSEQPFTGTSTQDSLAQNQVTGYYQSGSAAVQNRIEVGRTGRYVRVQLTANSQVLTLAEVQVYGQAVSSSNLALAGTATQSSTILNADAARAIDGNTDGRWNNNSVTHTNLGSQNYWQVDLGSIKQISDIKIWNRTDCCAQRLSDFRVFVSDVPFAGSAVTDSENQAGVFQYQHSGAASTTTQVSVNRTGRYVRIQLTNTDSSSGDNVLSLAEVEVNGF